MEHLLDTITDPRWREVLSHFLKSDVGRSLEDHFKQEHAQGAVWYPHEKNIFTALNLTSFEKVKVVILGQDPYHGEGQAHGLSFSVPQGVPQPPSLKNIFKELKSDLGIDPPLTGTLTGWAQQGVLLLNAILTVRAGEPASHRGCGWKECTDEILSLLSQEREHLVFILWGKYAQSKKTLIDQKKHYIIESAHPSPLSAYAGFFGSKPFSQTNEYLSRHGKTPIEWEKFV